MLTRSVDPRNTVVLDDLWANPAHWNRDGSYCCSDDPRLLVRDRARIGWTLNMAHRTAQVIIWSFLLGVIAFVVVITIVATR